VAGGGRGGVGVGGGGGGGGGGAGGKPHKYGVKLTNLPLNGPLNIVLFILDIIFLETPSFTSTFSYPN
jgi:hypothetical protein